MADVTRDERGQLVLLTAISIAALLVLVAALLSAAVYTENVATRDTTADDARAAQLYRVAAVEAVAGITDRANQEGMTPDEFNATVANWSDLHARQTAVGGASTRVSVRSMRTDVTVAQSTAGQLTDGNDTRDLFSNATGVDSWRLTVENDSLVSPAATGAVAALETADAFRVVVTNGTATWRAFVYENGTDVEVRVDQNGTLSAPCATTPDASGTVTIDLVSHTVGTNACPALAFESVAAAPNDISYAEGATSSAVGTYELVVPYISEVRIDVTYTTTDLEYVVRDVDVEGES